MLELTLQHERGGFHLDIDSRIEGPVVGVYGPSGSGKTTLLHHVAGLVKGARGRVVLDGTVLFDSERSTWTPPWQRRIGMVFQDARLFPHRSVRGNLCYGAKHAPGGERRFTLDDIAELLDIRPLLDRRPGNLSGGEAQRVALGRALLSQPKLLLLDEPLASLDPGLKRQILPFLRRIRDQLAMPMVVVSHDLGEILGLTDQLLLLDRGRLAGQGAFQDLASDPATLGLLREDGFPNMLRLRVAGQEPERGMTLFDAVNGGAGDAPGGSGLQVKGPPYDADAGTIVHASLRSTDIALVRAPVEGISMQNQVEGRVTRLVHQPERTVCQVDVGVRLLVEITRRSVDELGLHEGGPVWCLFKTHSLRYLDR